ncbi:MAG TPA: hypothetical protein VFG31_01905, partial [Conexibacter sp.]|nr:hypothetical protein [Conexibacter sp.]
ARVTSFTASGEGDVPPDGTLPLLAVRERHRSGGSAGALDVHVFTPGRPTPRARPGDVLLAFA